MDNTNHQIRREQPMFSALERTPSVRVTHNTNAPVLVLPTVAHDQTLHTSTFTPMTPLSSSTSTANPGVVSHEYEVNEHMLTIEAVALRYRTSIHIDNLEASFGLTVEEAAKRLQTNGPNALTPPVTRQEWIKYIVHFSDPLILLLILASILAFISFGLTSDITNAILGGVLIALVIFSSTMAYYQERSASDVINSIKQQLPASTKVRRGGVELSIPACELVVGDLVHLTIGNRIPADIRIIASSDLKVEMASITGESDAIACSSVMKSQLVAESRCVLFSTSLVMNGSCYGIVIRTGDKAFIGCIAHLAGKEQVGLTTMEIELKRVVKVVVCFAIVTSVSLFSIGMARGLGFVFSFVNAFILVLIANVPEGLPATVAGLLNLTARDMAKENIFIKRVELIETLGSASVICSDKTGTLTTNVMTVQNLWLNRSFSRAKGNIRRVQGITDSSSSSSLQHLDHAETLAGVLFVSDSDDEDEDMHLKIRQGQSLGRAMSFFRGQALIHSSLPAMRRRVQAPSTIASVDLRVSEECDDPVIGRNDSILSTESAPPNILMSLSTSSPILKGDNTIGSEGGDSQQNDSPMRSPIIPPSSSSSSSSHGTPPATVDGFAELNSFRTFTGLANEASWESSNAFTRCATIAAICNKANFASSIQENTNITSSQHNTDQHQHTLLNGEQTRIINVHHNEISRFESFLSTRHPQGLRPLEDIDRRIVLGDASDAAFLRYADALTPIPLWRATFPLLFEVPFNSETKFALVVTTLPENANMHLSMMKGAPERVLDICSTYFDKGLERPIDEEFKREWQVAYERFALMGERVFAMAYHTFPACSSNLVEAKRIYASDSNANVPRVGYVFLGLVSLIDPPKKGVKEAVEKCRAASIKVSMVTGDAPLTAEAIARKVGIITLPTAREVAAMSNVSESEVHIGDTRVRAVVIAGHSIPNLSESDWNCIIEKEEAVFARTSPQQKLEIVENYQRLGHVVAVTGDGTNDAPALKKANIGVAMGSAEASDVAREAADVILLDDNFASIVVAIERGRTVFDNIKKTCAYTLTHIWPELAPVFLVMIFDIPLMLPSLLILIVDIITEQGPAVSLTFEKSESSVMLRPPRNRAIEKLADTPLILYSYFFIGLSESMVCILAFFTVFISQGIPSRYISYHRTLWQQSSPTTDFGNGIILTGSEQVRIYQKGVAAYFLTLVLCQSFHIFLTKTRLTSCFIHPFFENKVTLIGVAFSISIAAFCIYVPVINNFFVAAPVSVVQWTIFFCFAAFVLIWTETVKYCARRYKDPQAIVHRYFAW
jgi:magnesium-transporting ATPase (P-type)